MLPQTEAKKFRKIYRVRLIFAIFMALEPASRPLRI
jgi:hypothetical protein